ncbi:MAG TPA: cytochrome c oxidase accessory protein CcoG [Burkholderiales bacterium]
MNDAALHEISLYEVRQKIYPRAVHGRFAAWRWALVLATQLVFYGGPWLTWNGRQALLFDIVQRKFHLLGLVFWPQDVIYLAVLLIISALSLFLFTAVAGRLWCGYACPQTVYTEIFLWIERMVEGDRNARMRLDKQALGPQKIIRKSLKHGAWIALSLWTGFTFVGYFTPIRDLMAELGALALGPWESFWVLFYGFATYGNAGWMREQVCKYMCPYARFQSAMFDKDTLIITYDAARGEPRGKKAQGDCVDCGICVQACPTGIDIRNGLQYECIGCAACIDGCDQVMDKVGRARGLIRYSKGRILRPRILVYTFILCAISAAMAASLYLRVPLMVDVIRDRAAISREVEGGLVENVYRVHIMNTAEQARAFDINVSGLPGIVVWGENITGVPAASAHMIPVRVRADAATAAGSHPIEFTVRALGVAGVEVREETVFIVR